MGMGWTECNYNIELSRRKCKCGCGFVITYEHINEESDYPPFTRSDITFSKCNCPKKCE